MKYVSATHDDDHDLSLMYIYVTPREEFPGPDHLFSESRETEITLDYERGTGRLLGVEVITRTAPDKLAPVPEVGFRLGGTGNG